jgi:hypothetical protein
VLAAVALTLAGCGGKSSQQAQAAGLHADRFDRDRAFADLRHQVEMGPRPARSAAARELARWLRARLPHGRIEKVRGGYENVVGRIGGPGKAIVVAAHYDTKDLPGFVGANDGAAGTAAVVELARALRAAPRPKGAPEIRFVLFDGEEATDDARPFEATGLRGSRAYAARHANELRALILLDFVAGRGMRIRREASSDPALWQQLREAARRAGAAGAFPAGTGAAITDDHVPFLNRGVPAIDLIQWPYACWHEPCDDLGAVSQRSLDQTGETVLVLVRTLSRT